MDNQDRDERIATLELILSEPYWYTKVELICEYHSLKRMAAAGWTIEKTAHILGRSVQSLHADLAIGRQLIKWPDLKNCRTRKDAEQSARARS